MWPNTHFDVFGEWGLVFCEFFQRKQARNFRLAIGSVGLDSLGFIPILCSKPRYRTLGWRENIENRIKIFQVYGLRQGHSLDMNNSNHRIPLKRAQFAN